MSLKLRTKALVTMVMILTIVSELNAQEIRIPFRVGDKFGLSNEKGELKVDAQYDRITFMESKRQHFQYSNIIPDSVPTMYGGWEPQEKYSNGVIYNDKVIIESERYQSFGVYRKHFIVGSLHNSYRPEDCMLYNLEGKELLDSEVSSIYFNSKRELGKLRFVDSNLVLITIYHHGKGRDFKYSIFSYDINDRKIKQWILKEVSRYGMIREVENKNAIYVQYTDEKGIQNKILSYNSTKKEFILSTSIDDVPEVKNAQKYPPNYRNVSPGVPMARDVAPEANPPEVNPRNANPRKTPTPIKREKTTFFSLRLNKALFYGEQEVAETLGMKFISMDYRQLSPMIYELDGKYGLITNLSSKTAAKYDTLFYIKGMSPSLKDLGYLYLTGKKDPQSKSWKFGVMNHLEEIIIPIEYDCLIPHIPNLTWKFLEKYFDKPLNFFTAPVKGNPSWSRKVETYYRVGKYGLVGEKNGKVGIVTLDNEILFQFEYDGFYYNGLEYSSYQSLSDFMIVGKDGKYAMIKDLSISEKDLKKKFIFPFLPSSCFLNYAGEKELNIVRLIDADGLFCYARDDGFVYYQKK